MTILWILLTALATLGYDAPDTWIPEEAPSGMRVAQWIAPGDDGAEAAEVVIFFFGPGDGGSAEANLDRWMGQFTQPDGTPTRDRAKISNLHVNGLALTVLDVQGTYASSVRPGVAEPHEAADYRMVAVVVEGEGGPWFVRLLGPASSVEKHRQVFDAFLKTLRLE